MSKYDIDMRKKGYKNENININKEIKDSVKHFFDKNSKKCLELLVKADDPKISNIYELEANVVTNSLNQYFNEVDILILTANKYETNILHKNIYDKQNMKRKTKKKKIKKVAIHHFNSICYLYFFEWGKYKVVHIMASSTGSNTVGGSEDMIRFAFQFEAFHPLAVISFGICFGIDYKKQNLGDVVISEKVYSYGEGIKVKDDKVEISDDNNFAIADSLHRSIKNLRNMNIISELNGEYLGNYITGEAVMSNEDFKQKLIKSVSTNRVMAGEMEGYGMFKECTYYGKKSGSKREEIPCIIIKAICDWGAQKNNFLSTLNFDQKEEKVSNTNIEEIKEIYCKIIQLYYESKSLKLKDDIEINEIEDIVKNSIQAYSAESAFQTCDKIFENETYVFGMRPYKKACDFIKGYKRDKNNSIYYDTLWEAMKLSNGYFDQDKFDEVINKLIEDDILAEIKPGNKNVYRIITE